MGDRTIFLLAPLLLLALGGAGPVVAPGQPIILQGPVGPDIVPGLSYGQFPLGMEPRLPILPPATPIPPVGAVPYGTSPTQTLPGCQAYAQSYQRLDCENAFNRATPAPVRPAEENPPIPPNFPSGAAVPAVAWPAAAVSATTKLDAARSKTRMPAPFAKDPLCPSFSTIRPAAPRSCSPPSLPGR
jgi:hypothetical protein